MNDDFIKVAGEVLLPNDQHQLYCWKVRNGSAVQRGETIALAFVKPNGSSSSSIDHSTTNSDSPTGESSTVLSSSLPQASDAVAAIQKPSIPAAATDSSSSSNSAHRRPTIRRRPGAMAATSTTATANASSDASSETDPTTAVSTVNQPPPVMAATSSPSSDQQQQQHRVAILASADGLVRMGTAPSAASLLKNKNDNPLLIGYIEVCSHSTVVDSLCAVCGAQVNGASPKRGGHLGDDDEDDDDEGAANGSAMSRVTVSGGVTVSVSAVEGQRMAMQDAQRLQRLRKLSLVLDLDHTLLHATNDIRARQEALSRDDVRTLVLPIMEDPNMNAARGPNHQNQQQQQQRNHHPQVMWMQHFVKLRPHVKEFLESAITMYEIGVYTAGTRQYAEQITIILARHLVGAQRDQTDLDQLRHEIACVQHKLAEQGHRHNNNSYNNDCRKPAPKPVPASASASKINDPTATIKADGSLTNGTKSTTTIMEKHDTTQLSSEDSIEGDGNIMTTETTANCNGDTFESPIQVGDTASTTNNEAVSSNASTTVTKDVDSAADKLKKAPNGDSKPAATAALLDEVDEKKTAINDSKEDSMEDKDDSEINLKSALKEDDGDKKKAAKGAGKKRKRVTFGDIPPTVKSDDPTNTTSEELEKLLAELREAERLEAMAHDLRQRLFGSRVVSRTDVKDLGTDVKSLKRIFPCGGTMAVVVDDREDVWANAGDTDMVPKGEPPHNLLVVRPYHWNHFLGYADVNNASGEDLAAELDTSSNKSKQYDNDQDEKQLLWTGDILRRIHQRYYGDDTAATKTATKALVKSRLTVPELVRNMRREVLMGTKIILSGLVPLHRQEEGGRTRLRPAFVRYAENLGAIILPRVGPGLTHVVAAKDGTEKIMNARKVPGCWIVKATWLMEAAWSLKRPESHLHALGPPPKIQPQSDISDDDDDLAAELENELIGE